MILYEEDWDTHPEAIVDTQTRNTSFIRYSSLLKEMGIRNHLWPLQLLNPELQGVDPYDPYLTIDQMMAIAVECKLNFFYFIREVSRDPKGSKDRPVRFKASRGLSLYWLYFNHITTFLCVPRQSLKSFSMSALYTYLLNVACTNTTLALLTKDNVLRASTLSTIKDMTEELPPYLMQLSKNDIANTEEIMINSLGNRLIAQLPSSSPKSALKCLIGTTNSSLWADELGYLNNVGLALPTALATTTAARALAKDKGEPYGNIYTSTAASKDDRDGKYAYNLAMSSALWTEKFLDVKDIEDLDRTIRKNSTKGELRVYMVFSHKQLGYTDAWLRDVMANSEAAGPKAAMDFLNMWMSGTNSSPLTKELSDKIRESQHNDYNTEITPPYGYVTRWFIDANEIQRRMSIGHYILSCDSSDAAGGDDIALSLRDIRNGAIVAAGNYNETNLITFADYLVSWLVKYPNITLIIERRSSGAMILDYLLLMLPGKGIDPFTRIYNKGIQDASEYPDRYKEISKPIYTKTADLYTKYKKLFGFATSGSGTTSRAELYSTTLLAAAKMTGDKVYDPMTIDQILGLEIKNGRVDHGSSEGNGHTSHDDMVISWLLSYWFISLGKNLHMYGINPKEILVDNRVHQVDNDPRALYDTKLQQDLRYRIEELSETIKKEPDDYVSYKLETQLRLLIDQLSYIDNQVVLSVDTLINNLRESRKSVKQYNRHRYW